MVADSTSGSDPLFRLVLIVVGFVLLAPLVLMLFFVPAMMGTMGGHGMWAGDGMANAWFWWALWGLGLLVLVGIGYLLYRGLLGDTSRRDPAIEELRRAYARGDLTEDEFEERKRRLEN